MVQSEIRSFVSVLRSHVTPFDRGKVKSAILQTMGTVAKSETFLATVSAYSAPLRGGGGGGKLRCKFWHGTKVKIFDKEKCKIPRQFERETSLKFWKAFSWHFFENMQHVGKIVRFLRPNMSRFFSVLTFIFERLNFRQMALINFGTLWKRQPAKASIYRKMFFPQRE